MFQKLRNHGLIAFIFFALSLAQQYGFYTIKGLPIIWLPFGKYLGTYCFFLFFSFAKGHKTRYLLLSFLMILNFFQMVHLSYFGTQILPSEFSLIFTQAHEIAPVLITEFQHLLISGLLTIVPLALGFWAFRKLKTALAFKTVPVLFALYFAYNPIRTYVTGNTWGRQPSTRELSGMNVYLSLSYFLGKILPHKLSSSNASLEENESLKLKVTEGKQSEWDNIIVVQGESLTPNHMSLFGYDLKTTEYLDSIKEDRRFFHVRGLSSGVSTDISVAFFLNLGYGHAGSIKAAKGEHCLFKLAKEKGRSTHFFSTQSAQQLRYIAPYVCSAYLDDYRSLENISPATANSDAAVDRDMLPKLDALLQTEGQKFVILHQRGSHGPWKLRFTPEADKFKNADERIAYYDNSVVEFDLFWKELSTLLSKQKTKTLLIYLSDHGEAVGEHKRWGHGFLHPTSFEIPMLIQSFNEDLPPKTRQLPVNVPQYNLGLYIVNELGWKTNQSPFSIMQDFVIFGNDIDGFAGKAKIKFGVLNKYDYQVIP